MARALEKADSVKENDNIMAALRRHVVNRELIDFEPLVIHLLCWRFVIAGYILKCRHGSGLVLILRKIAAIASGKTPFLFDLFQLQGGINLFLLKSLFQQINQGPQ